VSRALIALIALLAACGVSSDVSREIGARCDDQDECDDRCLTGARFPDGMCSRNCDTDGDCPEGTACVGLAGGSCLYNCTGDRACEFLGEGWQCVLEAERGGEPDSMVMICAAPP
jgi:hypothetical protein